MVGKNQTGQIIVEFLILMVCLVALFSVIKYRVNEQSHKPRTRWEKK